MAQVLECLPNKYKALSSIHSSAGKKEGERENGNLQ
jgi:hypothetical protein